MCGIFGVITKKTTSNHKLCETFGIHKNKIMEYLKPRGPNASGIFEDTKCMFVCCSSDKNFEACDVPHNYGGIILMYDGEILNFHELREQLIIDGKRFKTQYMSEIIVQCYETYGPEFVEKFIGNFTICLYDTKRKEIYLYRDRFGVKPLFYVDFDDIFVFSSSINTIIEYFDNKPNISQSSLITYMTFKNVLDNNTFYENIKKLLPGHYIVIQRYVVTLFSYWKLNQENVNAYSDIYEAMSNLDAKITNAISLNISQLDDINISLSGGLGSSTLVYYIKKILSETTPIVRNVNTYSIGFDSENEFAYSTMIADGFQTEHTNILTTTDEYIENMIDLINFKCTPLCDPDEPFIYTIAQRIKSTSVNDKCILSGDGVDELFHGYGKIFISHYNYLNDTSEPFYKYFVDRFACLPPEYRQKIFNSKYEQRYTEVSNENLKIFEKHFNECDELHYQDKIDYVLLKMYLPMLLERLDSSTNIASVNSLLPFIDHTLVEYCFYRIYREHKIMLLKEMKTIDLVDKPPEEISEKFDSPKYILKKLMQDKLPIDVTNRKKNDFTVPLDRILAEKYEVILRMLTDGSIRELQLFDLDYLKQKFISHSCDPYDNMSLWLLLNIEIFTRLFSENKQICDVKSFFHVDPLFKYEKDKLMEKIILSYETQLQRYIKFYVVKTILEKFNIEYFAIGDTMLGCVRHKGFVPWCDSICIMILEHNCAKFTGDFLMELLYAGFQIKKSTCGYTISDFFDTSSNFFVDIYIARYIEAKDSGSANGTQIIFSSQQLMEEYPSILIISMNVFPLVKYDFGFFTIYGMKDPIKYFDSCEYGNFMRCAIVTKLHNRENNDILIAFLKKYGMKSLSIRDQVLLNHRDNVIYTNDWIQYFNRTKDLIPNDFNTENYKLLNSELSKLDTMELYIHYVMKGRFEKKIYSVDSVLPADFDVRGYRCLNPDISHLVDHLARIHYVTIGKSTGRKYNIRTLIPYDFDTDTYKYLNMGLSNLTDDELIAHYVHHGNSEGLYYKTDGILPPDFDAKKYIKINKDLKITTDREAIIHYINIGRKESRKYK